ncbi:helix-turn-helix domain-containing protein [Haloechinothrix sp. YIM 98757]|uniref:Helix-turn-helix domain-containing protein n=1 Tax=Haloechinothrix aidingensis TaxID=2752311 RepID=A0A838A839_9PSEU|nr:helix-turn-helix transcriptional regulator [Haloechinothrix aidingensis]MBA0124549.1 helix-turn-helix domain-containing protein [Haloechinothrix aidingensis]
MPPTQNLSARSRQVSTELRRLREEAGMSGAQVAEILGMSPSKVSRIETGNRGLHVEDVAALLGLYRVPEQRREELLDLVRKASEPGWWSGPATGSLPSRWREFLRLETDATKLYNFELSVVPGLLQTAEYAAALISGFSTTLTESEVDELVTMRMGRQVKLRHPGTSLIAIIDEMVLRRCVGDPGVMRRQLHHLADEAGRPNITVRVVPLQAGQYVGWKGPFFLMDFADQPSLVILEAQGTAMYLEERADVEYVRTAISGVVDKALSPADSVKLIKMLADEIYPGEVVE